jgi:hypothetical protein
MEKISDRNEKLSTEEVAAFIKDHLPYRVKILKTVINYPFMLNTDKYWPSIYESAQITCRMFIQFFGFGVEWKGPFKLVSNTKYTSFNKSSSHEVKIKDLGFDFIGIDELNSDEQSILAHAYEAGSKATAHLNWNENFRADPAKVIEAAKIILRILCEKIPQLRMYI